MSPDGALSSEYRAFFDQYRADLSQDFETSLIWRQLLSFRWINSALAARTLAEILRAQLHGDARIQDFSAREKAGDTPGIIINTTLCNNGRRLALTSLPNSFPFSVDEARLPVELRLLPHSRDHGAA